MIKFILYKVLLGSLIMILFALLLWFINTIDTLQGALLITFVAAIVAVSIMRQLLSKKKILKENIKQDL